MCVCASYLHPRLAFILPQLAVSPDGVSTAWGGNEITSTCPVFWRHESCQLALESLNGYFVVLNPDSVARHSTAQPECCPLVGGCNPLAMTAPTILSAVDPKSSRDSDTLFNV